MHHRLPTRYSRRRLTGRMKRRAPVDGYTNGAFIFTSIRSVRKRRFQRTFCPNVAYILLFFRRLRPPRRPRIFISLSYRISLVETELLLVDKGGIELSMDLGKRTPAPCPLECNSLLLVGKRNGRYSLISLRVDSETR